MSWQTTDLTIEAELAYRRERLLSELSRSNARRDERRARREARRAQVRPWTLRARRGPAVGRAAAEGWSAVGER